MKKLLSLMLCLVLLMGLATTAYAADNETIVSLEVPPETYILKIPPTVTIDATSKENTFTVAVEDVNLIWSSQIIVKYEAANAIDGETGSYLLNSDSGKKIPYTIANGYNAHYQKGKTNTALEANGNATATMKLFIDEEFTYPGAGTFTDTLTFSVSFR